MCNKENLVSRREKANACAMFAQVTQYDNAGRVRAVNVPGSNGKLYQVIIRRARGLSTEMLLHTGNGHVVKPSFVAQVTYHQMAAIQVAASEAGYKVTWFASEYDAKKYAHFGGKVFCLKNRDNPNSVMWGVMQKEEKE